MVLGVKHCYMGIVIGAAFKYRGIIVRRECSFVRGEQELDIKVVLGCSHWKEFESIWH